MDPHATGKCDKQEVLFVVIAVQSVDWWAVVVGGERGWRQAAGGRRAGVFLGSHSVITAHSPEDTQSNR